MSTMSTYPPRPQLDRKSAKNLRIQIRKVISLFRTKSQRRLSSPKVWLGDEKLPTVVEITCSTPDIPTSQTALVVARKGEYELRSNHDMPKLESDDEVIIRTHAVGLNPIDWKSVSYNFCLPSFPHITGREMAGVVERVGTNVTHLQPGDPVWTSTYYRDPRAGCFQEYVTVPQHTVHPIPRGLSFEEASCLGVGALTAAMTLWKWLDVPVSDAAASEVRGEGEGEWIFIWGGSTVTGQFATQIAKLGGLRVITVCSGRTAELSRALGADHVVVRDGRAEADILAEVERVTAGGVTRMLDLVGPKTAAACVRLCMSESQKGRRVVFAPLAMIGKEEVLEWVEVVTVEMKRFVLNVECGEYGRRLNDLFEASELKLPELEVLRGGLSVVEQGLEMLKLGNMGGKKLVVAM
ncbi:GroES-like protein [Trichodelitschia bisporula]|uniref:GroES-like protein n=1 Tax=Trichodelitschia bisporula TaxID=703511 RepID=A0A6G1HWZ8_9PEZI|nr:GroES-like protein [Trichodelitschia bisporula]